jgi:DNA modification methylase
MPKQIKLFSEVAEKASGKTIDALEYSRQERDRITEIFNGSPPISIMKASWRRKKGTDLASGTYEASGHIQDMSKPLAKTFSASGRGARRGALSQFPQNICEACVLLYSKLGDTVLDPFAGHNSRMECCLSLGRNYVGFDVSHAFMQFNVERYSQIQDTVTGRARLYESDSRHLDGIYKESADFCITSPPYYDIEYYGPEIEQLGNAENYPAFMQRIKEVALALCKRLKAGAFVAWFVNDFRRDGRFHAYHADTIDIFRRVGFTPWDIMVVNLGWTMRAGFVQETIAEKILPKVHEYGLIFRNTD